MTITERPVTESDLADCLALSAEAHWNQIAEDWRLILELGEVLGLVRDGRLVATAGFMPYGGRFAWISMVLVTASERRQGHATRLLRWAMARAEGRGLIAGLDATPEGREVYRRLGFRDIYRLTRLEANHPPVSAGPPRPGPGPGPRPGITVRPLQEADLDAVAAFDAAAFGADRRPVLADFRARMPDLALLAQSGGRIGGHVLARNGRRATQIGPLVAEDLATAEALLAAALTHAAGRVFIDLCDRHTDLRGWLNRRGFTVQRPFTRMLLGRADPLDAPPRIIAVAGPELG
jgi:GNAT superfamily N-acetyltransferase